MLRNYLEAYIALKRYIAQKGCVKAIQMVTLLVGVVVFFIHKECILMAISYYFALEFWSFLYENTTGWYIYEKARNKKAKNACANTH